MEPPVEDALAYLLDLRLRCRGNREATALIDRCLALLAQAECTDAAALARLESEIETLRTELAERFGPPQNVVRH